MTNIRQLSSKDKALIAAEILTDVETSLTIAIAATHKLMEIDEESWEMALMASNDAAKDMNNCGHQDCNCETLSALQANYFQWVGALREIDKLNKGD